MLFKKKKKMPTDDEIMDLWRCGDDTAVIARYFRVDEPSIANRLAKLLDKIARATCGDGIARMA